MSDKDSLSDFLSGLQGRILESVQEPYKASISSKDSDFSFICTPAPNAIEWAVKSEYLNVPTVYDHWRQYQVIRDFFQLRCPLPSCNDQSPEAIDVWGKGRETLQSENLLVWNASAEEDVCPSCKTTRSELYADGLIPLYNQMHVISGMRSGKSSVAGILGTYAEHMAITIGHRTEGGLSKYFNQLPNQPFEITFIASTDVQSQDTIWAKYTGLRSDCPWIKKYIKWVKQKETEQKTISGAREWKYEELQKHIFNGALNLKINTLNSNCFVGDTPVLMADYTRKPINSVSVGDKVIDRHGHTQVVENAWKEDGIGSLVEIKTLGGKTILSTPNHKFPVWAWARTCACGCGDNVKPGSVYKAKHFKCGTQKKTITIQGSNTSGHRRKIPSGYEPHMDLMAKDIRSGDFLMIPRSFDEVRPHKITKDHARLLGYFVSEGCDNRSSKMRGNKLYGTEFSFNVNEDLTIAQDVRNICDNLGIYHKTNYIANRNVLVISTSGHKAIKMATWLRENGGHYAKHKVLSPEVMRWPLSLKENLLCGMYRGDGTHYLNSGTRPSISYGTASEQLAYQTQLLLAQLGFYGGVVEHIRKAGTYNKNETKQYYINSGGIQCESLAKMIWGPNNRFSNNVRLKHQRSFFMVTDHYVYIPIKSVKTIKSSAPVYNLTVSSDHSYVVDNVGTYNSGGMAGRTRLAAFIDELSRFENTDSKRSADEAYRVLENSLRTIRSISSKMKEAPWLGTMVSISSPISEDDKAMRLLKQAPSIKHMYYGHYATWEFNPFQPRSEFDDDFEKDPIGAMRDFGARPPTAASPLITDTERFRELSIQKDLKPTASFNQYIYTDKVGRDYISTKVDTASLARNGERYMCFDAGATFDQFAGACAHGEWVYTPEGRHLVTVYDWVFRMIPEHKPRRDIWFDSVVQIIENLAKYYFISRIDFDRWQSTYLIQQIRDRGISCEMKGTTSDQFSRLINDVNFSRVRMLPPMPNDAQLEPPQMSAQGLAFYELERLERTPDLKKVFNPRKGSKRGWDSDDVATVVAHVNEMVQSSIVDLSTSNNRNHRMKRESMGGHNWSDRGSVFRAPGGNKRGW